MCSRDCSVQAGPARETAIHDMGETMARNTRADVARILESINDAARDLGLRGAGNWAVETMGGSYLYLTDRTGKLPTAGAHGYPPEGTGPGEKIEDLGNGWHSAYERLFTLRRDLLTVQVRQGK